MNAVTQANDTIVVEIDIDAPPERVFQAWIDPQQRLAWWGDEDSYRCTKMDSDLRVGGHWRSEGTGKTGNPFIVSGEYTRIDPPWALGFTWDHAWRDESEPTTHVLIELVPTSSGTHVTVTHSGFVKTTSRDDHSQGWNRVLGWLRGYLQAR